MGEWLGVNVEEGGFVVGGAPHLTGCGVYEMLAIRSTDLSKGRKIRITNCSWSVLNACFILFYR